MDTASLLNFYIIESEETPGHWPVGDFEGKEGGFTTGLFLDDLVVSN